MLDCCYAGQAVRSYSQYKVEFFAATDKDQFTPSGSAGEISFTEVLAKEMLNMLNTEGLVTLRKLHARMVEEKVGLAKQPLYVSLSQDTAGQIQMRSLRDRVASVPPEQSIEGEDIITQHLRVSMLRPPDSTSITALVHWMTTESPTSIQDIEFVKNEVSKAQTIEQFGDFIVHQPGTSSRSFSAALSANGRTEIAHLLGKLKASMTVPAPPKLRDEEAIGLVSTIRNNAQALVTVVEDCIACSDIEGLQDIAITDSAALADIRARVSMRMTLLRENGPSGSTAVKFVDPPERNQRFRLGKQGDIDVLTEYWYYDATGDAESSQFEAQVAKVSTLLAEPKPYAFRSLPGRGYLHEILYGARVGFVYEIPSQASGKRYEMLSNLIQQGKTVPLELRIRMANVLCEALLHLHSVGWLHKGIKSANVLVFAKDTLKRDSDLPHDIYDLENPYLVGFDCSRPADAETRRSADFRAQENLYRHPMRWGRPARFERYHDLYALGILLYELGRWRLLSQMDQTRKGFENIRDPEKLRDFLLGTCHTQLRHYTGSVYATAARTCVDRREAEWMALDEWQMQRMIRTEILSHL
ncbi:MAG: hypothetical protein M1821_007049 [Bathelium mastoideum]|nr:MAG: hypothetical protein M1821_007049 [Bathelium mastoideum]